MRQAVVHSINCQEIVESLYQGATTCRGNHGAPGVLGITEENIRPYEYNPDKAGNSWSPSVTSAVNPIPGTTARPRLP